MKIKVMTFNLRYDKPDLGNRAWQVRKAAVAALIATLAEQSGIGAAIKLS